MTNPIPPELQSLLDRAKELGIDVQVLRGPPPKEGECGCPVCTQDRALRAKREAQAKQPGQPAEQTKPGAREFLTKLTNELTDMIVGFDKRSLSRDTDLKQHYEELRSFAYDINTRYAEHVDTLNAGYNTLRNEITSLRGELESLKESHRKQIGLLHKRVTKRKAEVRTVASKKKAALLTK
jgi:hypothetical protein